MNTFGAANFTGAVSAGNAAVLPNELTRLGEMQALLSGKAAKAHTHSLDDILDEPVKFLVRVDEVIADSGDIVWVNTGNVMYGQIRLDPSGRITKSGSGLAVDLAGVMLTGDGVTVSQITDFAPAFALQLGADIADTNDIVWQRGSVLSGKARLAPGGGIVSSVLGLKVDTAVLMAVGSSITWSQISDESTQLPIAMGGIIADTNDIVWQRGSVLSGKSRLAPGGGIVSSVLGLKVDTAVFMAVGSSVTVAQITDFNAGFAIQLGADIADTNDIVWQRGSVLSGKSRLAPGGGILSSALGLMIDTTVVMATGSAITTAQISDFAAAFALQLGAAIADTNDIVWQRGSVLSGKARLAPGGGILSSVLGLKVDTTVFMAVGSSIVFSQIADTATALPVALGNIIADTADIVWSRGAQLSGTARLKPSGGLIHTPTGLAIDPAIVSTPSSTFTVSQITDFAAGILVQLGNDVADTNTIFWTNRGGILSGNARLNPTGGLTADTSGIRCVFGTGANTVAMGNHGHSQLHDPVTLGSSQSIAFSLGGQVIAGEVALRAASGLTILPTGLGVDFGYGATQALPGSAFAILSGLASNSWTAVSTPSILFYFDGSVFSGNARLDPAPPPGFGTLQVTAGGLSMMLGTTSSTAAAGNHSHATATESVNGFMSALDKTALDTLVAAGAPVGLSVTETQTIKLYYNSGTGLLSGTAKIDPAPGTNCGSLGFSINGLYAVLGTTATTAAAGNHNHDSVYLKLAGGTLTAPLILAADPAVALGAATKQYVDGSYSTFAGNYLPLTGGTLTGTLVLAGNPTSNLHAAPKQYVDTGDTLRLLLAGGTMTGALILNADPSNVLGAATKQYVDAAAATKLPINGGTMTGLLILSGDPSNVLGAATKQYVDTGLGTKVPLAGGTMSGLLTLSGNPTASNHAATKTYTDTADNLRLLLAGGTMSGFLNLSADPTNPSHAANKNYVDTQDGLALPLSGGTMSGTLVLAGNPSGSNEAANKSYVDGIVAAVLGTQSAIANAVNAAGDPPTGAEFNALVTQFNAVLTMLRNIGLPP